MWFIRPAGLPLASNYNYLYGYTDPVALVGFANSIRWNNFQIGLRFDGRIGGFLNNYSSYKMWDTGSHPDSDNQYRYDEVVNGNKSYVGQGVKVIGGTITYDNLGQITSDTREFAPNDTKVSYQSYARSYGDGTRGVTNATFIKTTGSIHRLYAPQRLCQPHWRTFGQHIADRSERLDVDQSLPFCRS